MTGFFKALGPHGFGTYEVTISPEGDASFEARDGEAEALLVPGFVDIHIHGAFGIDFMSASAAEMGSLSKDLRDQGYEHFLPTTVTASLEAVEGAIANLPSNSMVVGFHLEGPFISPVFPGAQPKEFILGAYALTPAWKSILSEPRLKVATVAPEILGGMSLIRTLSSHGVRVGMGHTNASFAEAKAGREAGASHTTHTYNAMRPLHHREAGMVGFALTDDGLGCELIYDRLHVCRDAAALLVKCKPSDKLIGISDGTKAAGLAPGTKVDMWGSAGTVGNGDVRLADGTLAGSAATLKDVFLNMLEDFGPETAIRACCLNPRRLLGLRPPPRVWLKVIGREITLLA